MRPSGSGYRVNDGVNITHSSFQCLMVSWHFNDGLLSNINKSQIILKDLGKNLNFIPMSY